MIAGMIGVAAILRSRRRHLGATQKLMAQITGVPIREIGKIESASANVSFEHLVQLAWWLDVAVSFTLMPRRK